MFSGCWEPVPSRCFHICTCMEIYYMLLACVTLETKTHNVLSGIWRQRKVRSTVWRPKSHRANSVNSSLCPKAWELEWKTTKQMSLLRQSHRLNSTFLYVFVLSRTVVDYPLPVLGKKSPSTLLSSFPSPPNVSLFQKCLHRHTQE